VATFKQLTALGAATASAAAISPGHGTFEFESASGVYTELQCGSYIFMDADYGRNLDHDGAPTRAFEPSLFVWATVMSRPTDDRAIVDAGLKALAFDPGPPLVYDEPAATYERASDEHGRLAVSAATNRLNIGDKIRLIPAIATRPSTSTTGMSASAPTASSSSGRSPRVVWFIKFVDWPYRKPARCDLSERTHPAANTWSDQRPTSTSSPHMIQAGPKQRDSRSSTAVGQSDILFPGRRCGFLCRCSGESEHVPISVNSRSLPRRLVLA
jgi:hypothetical protein